MREEVEREKEGLELCVTPQLRAASDSDGRQGKKHLLCLPPLTYSPSNTMRLIELPVSGEAQDAC